MLRPPVEPVVSRCDLLAKGPELDGAFFQYHRTSASPEIASRQSRFFNVEAGRISEDSPTPSAVEHADCQAQAFTCVQAFRDRISTDYAYEGLVSLSLDPITSPFAHVVFKSSILSQLKLSAWFWEILGEIKIETRPLRINESQFPGNNMVSQEEVSKSRIWCSLNASAMPVSSCS